MTIDGPALEPDERLIWSGRPNALRYARNKGLMTCMFGIPWTIGTGYGLSTALSKADRIGSLIAAIFVGIGILLLLSPLWHLWRGLRTVYAITSKRLIVETLAPSHRRLSVPLNRVQFTELRRSSGSHGDIYFKETAVPGGEGHSLSREGFVAVADATEVERILRRTLDRAP